MSAEQISIFTLLGEDETPEIPLEQQKKGTKGWVIEIQGIFTVQNGYEKNMIGVTTKQVILKSDTHKDGHGWWQDAWCISGGCRGDGWLGTPKKLYARRPTWRECQEYVRKSRREPWEIVYTHKDGHACVSIREYERGMSNE